MKIAVFLQGEPRFCAEFDQTLLALGNEHSYDWYSWLWNPSPGPDTYGYDLVSDQWRSFTDSEAAARLTANFTANHRVVSLVSQDPKSLSFPDMPRRAGETNVQNVWRMYWSMWAAGELIFARADAQHYDLVLRLRQDVAVDNLNLLDCHRRLQDNPRSVIVSSNNHFGYWGPRLNDWVAVGTPESMKVYCDCYNHIQSYYDQGMLFHPESLLSLHLATHGVALEYGSYSVSLRTMGRWEDKKYFSQFGRW